MKRATFQAGDLVRFEVEGVMVRGRVAEVKPDGTLVVKDSRNKRRGQAEIRPEQVARHDRARS